MYVILVNSADFIGPRMAALLNAATEADAGLTMTMVVGGTKPTQEVLASADVIVAYQVQSDWKPKRVFFYNRPLFDAAQEYFMMASFLAANATADFLSPQQRWFDDREQFEDEWKSSTKELKAFSGPAPFYSARDFIAYFLAEIKHKRPGKK